MNTIDEYIDSTFNFNTQLIYGAKLTSKWGSLEYDINIKKYVVLKGRKQIYVGNDLNVALFEMEMLRST